MDEKFDLSTLDPQVRRIVETRILMKERDRARKRNDFTKSDLIRDKLVQLGVEIKDQKDGPSGWRFKDGSSNKIPPGIQIPAEAMKERKNDTLESNKQKKRSRDEEKVEEQVKKNKKKPEKPEVFHSSEHARFEIFLVTNNS